MIDWIESYVRESAAVPSPELYRLWSAITAVSGVLERKVWTMGSAGPIYPNMFTLLVGPPASGKTNAIRPIRDLWSRMNLLSLAPDNVTKAALIDALAKSERTVINNSTHAYTFSAMAVPCSEFGVFFTHHDLEFLSVLNHIYDSPMAYREERRTSGIVEINKPYLVVLAGTQPDFLNSFLPEEAWGMGFTSRLIMVYANNAPSASLFSSVAIESVSIARDLNKIFELKGEFTWSKEAIDEIQAWHDAGCPPAPDHSKLLHYNGRRSLHALKLSMISAVARSCSLHVIVDDFERARDWLLRTEKTMPDIFRAMGQRSDIQIMADLHYFMYRQWSAIAIEARKGLHVSEIYNFLSSRVPSEKIKNIVDMMRQTGRMRVGAYPDEWIPNPLAKFGNV